MVGVGQASGVAVGYWCSVGGAVGGGVSRCGVSAEDESTLATGLLRLIGGGVSRRLDLLHRLQLGGGGGCGGFFGGAGEGDEGHEDDCLQEMRKVS